MMYIYIGVMRGTLPIGTETPTNCPFCNAGPVLGTKFPRIIPTAIARKIHRARNRSRNPRDLKIEDSRVGGGCMSEEVLLEGNFSISVIGTPVESGFGDALEPSIMRLLDTLRLRYVQVDFEKTN
jgi:hypothetical protein